MSVEIRNLCKSFGTKKVLNNLNLTLEDGGIYCLMGPSGMGKTTLLRIIMNLEPKDSGEITGVDPETEISSMFQEDRILPMLNAVMNVNMMYEKKRPVKEIKEDLATILPVKCLRQPVCELSGGMKRRVSLARCMHFQGKMIILDEPFTGLDVVTKQEVINYILKNRGNRILLIATHGVDDAALLGAQVIHLEDCQELTPDMMAAMPVAQEAGEMSGMAGKMPGSFAEQMQKMAGISKTPQEQMEELISAQAYMVSHAAQGGIKLLDGIPEEKWDSLDSVLDGHIETFHKGQLVWNIGDCCSEFAVVLEGSVAAYTENMKHTESLIAKFGPGRCFGEMLPLSGECSPVKVVAYEHSRILFLSREKLMAPAVDIESGALKAKIAWNMVYEISDKLAKVASKLTAISENTVHDRLIKYLSGLPEDENGGRTMFAIQRETAQYLRVSPEALSKELNDMEHSGIIRRENNIIHILQPEIFEKYRDGKVRRDK